MESSATLKLIHKFTDAERIPLVAGSRDWEEIIIPALTEWVSFLSTGDVFGCMTILRIIIEVAYVLGYNRGKAEAGNPMSRWIVKEE